MSVVFWPELAGQRTLPFADETLNRHLVWAEYTASCLREGHFPWWSRFWAMGFPFASQMQTAVLHPATWLNALFSAEGDSAFFLTRHFIIHLLICGMGGYAFAFALCRRRWPATVAAVGLAFNGYLLYRFSQVAIVQTMVWLPWQLLAVRQTLRAGAGRAWSPGWAAAAVFTIYLSSLGGDPQLFLDGIYLALAYGLWVAVSAAWARDDEDCVEGFSLRRLVARLAALVMIMGIVGLLAAPQIVFMKDLTGQSESAAMTLGDSDPRPIEISSLYSSLLPAKRRMMEGRARMALAPPLLLFLALLSLVGLLRRGETWFWLSCGAFCLLVALGYADGLLAVLGKFAPGLKPGRAVECLLWPAHLSVCLLAAIGLTDMQDFAHNRKRRWLGFLFCSIAGGLALWQSGRQASFAIEGRGLSAAAQGRLAAAQERSMAAPRYRPAEAWDYLPNLEGRALSYRLPRDRFRDDATVARINDDDLLATLERLPTVGGRSPFVNRRITQFHDSRNTLSRRYLELTRAQYYWTAKRAGGVVLPFEYQGQTVSWSVIPEGEGPLLIGGHRGNLSHLNWFREDIERYYPKRAGGALAVCLLLADLNARGLEESLGDEAPARATVRIVGMRQDTGEPFALSKDVRVGPALIDNEELAAVDRRGSASTDRATSGVNLAWEKFPAAGPSEQAWSHPVVIELDAPAVIGQLSLIPLDNAQLVLHGLSIWTESGHSVQVPVVAALGYQPFYEGEDYLVYEYESPLPLFSWVGAWENIHWFPERGKIDRIFNPALDLNKTVLLERFRDPQPEPGAGDAPAPDNAGAGEQAAAADSAEVEAARVLEMEWLSPSKVRCRIKAGEPGFLVFWEAYYHGWRATVDGEPVEVERANYLFCAVETPAGEHEVVVWWRPPHWPLILVFPLLGAVALLALIGAALRRRRTDAKLSPT